MAPYNQDLILIRNMLSYPPAVELVDIDYYWGRFGLDREIRRIQPRTSKEADKC